MLYSGSHYLNTYRLTMCLLAAQIKSKLHHAALLNILHILFPHEYKLGLKLQLEWSKKRLTFKLLEPA